MLVGSKLESTNIDLVDLSGLGLLKDPILQAFRWNLHKFSVLKKVNMKTKPPQSSPWLHFIYFTGKQRGTQKLAMKLANFKGMYFKGFLWFFHN